MMAVSHNMLVAALLLVVLCCTLTPAHSKSTEVSIEGGRIKRQNTIRVDKFVVGGRDATRGGVGALLINPEASGRPGPNVQFGNQNWFFHFIQALARAQQG
ncbi:uncharacterized protein [Cherax quadricarinatus]|uniref:uncharacterized protein n=1 Tax=Cherax quadricarinatus TaxID=27406 RepID=UPI00387E6557